MITITPPLLAKIYDHALEAHPAECCGALIGHRNGDAVVKMIRTLTNTESDRAGYRYTIAPVQLLHLEQDTRKMGMDVIGFYHSHPSGAPYPSEFDRSRAWNGYSYLIVSVSPTAPPQARSWLLEGAAFAEEPLVSRE